MTEQEITNVCVFVSSLNLASDTTCVTDDRLKINTDGTDDIQIKYWHTANSDASNDESACYLS